MKALTVVIEIALCAVIGALIATMLGYAVETIAGHRVLPMTIWLEHPVRVAWWPWPMLGGLVGALSPLARRLSRA
jgi:hypothetical protein